MNIKYLFDSKQDYMNFFIDVAGKKVTGTYVRDSLIIVEKTIDIAAIIDISSSTLPHVELAKRGEVWDFHISKLDAFGKSSRKTLSIFADESFHPTKVEFNNPTTTSRVLKDLISYPLSVYDSPLTVIRRKFDVLDYVAGNSGGTSLSPILRGGGLLVDSDASLHITMAAGEIPLDQQMYITWKFKEIPNMATVKKVMEFKIGANTISFNKDQLNINGVAVKNLIDMNINDRFVIITNPTSNDAKIMVKGAVYDCEFYTHKAVGVINVSSNESTDEYVLEDLVIQASENYFLDSTPPPVVTHINAVSKDKEIFVDWKESEAEDINGYNVYVNGRVHNLALIKENNYQITGLANSVEYLVTVTAVDKSGNESVSAESFKLMTLSDPTSEISGLRVDTSEAGVHFKFTPPTYSGVDKIRIYRESMSNLGQQLIAEISHTAVEFLDEPKPSNGRYMYIITTVSLSGAETNGTKILYNIV